MKACVIHGARDLRVCDLAEPAPGPGETLIRLGASGICRSDLHYFADGRAGDFRLQEPMILGHEGAGQVVAVGRGVSQPKPGDRVAVNPNHPCGRCRQCEQGRRNLCRDVRYFDSAARFPHVNRLFAELFVADAANCYPIPERLSDRAAACAKPLAIALHAATQADSISGQNVCVVGSGPIGVLVLAVTKKSGAGADRTDRAVERMGRVDSHLMLERRDHE
jgi:L-idonate 5-dehydrogenase